MWHSPKTVVLIACPMSGELVPTGVFAGALDELPAFNLLVACDRCGEDHDWTRDEAVITAISE
jgi:hypothetical protein